MSKKILVRIILPSSTFLEEEANLVNIPGAEGVFGVLHGHSKIISSVKNGIVSLFVNDTEKKYYVHGGVAQVDGVETNIVTEYAASIEGSNKTSVTNEIIGFEEELSAQEEGSVEASIILDRIEKRKELIKFL